METIAITGTSGHLGNTLVRKLLKKHDGSNLRVLIHTHNTGLENLDLTRIHGDVCDINSVRMLCKGCTTIYHCASFISIVSYDKKKLHSINVEGTANVIKVAKENNAKLIYIGSVEAIGKQHDGIHNENDGFSPDHTLIEYGRSKATASLEVLKEVKEGNLKAVIICPAGITGPFEFGTSKVGKMVRDFLAKKLPATIKKGGFCFVDVRDVANAAIVAAEKGVIGRHYIVSSEYIEQVDMIRLISDYTGIPMPKMYISTSVLKFFAIFVELFAQISGKEPIYSSGTARILESQLKLESLYLEKELGIIPRSLADSLVDQIKWYRGEKVEL